MIFIHWRSVHVHWLLGARHRKEPNFAQIAKKCKTWASLLLRTLYQLIQAAETFITGRGDCRCLPFTQDTVAKNWMRMHLHGPCERAKRAKTLV